MENNITNNVVGKSLSEKLEDLQEALDSNLISEDEYNNKRNKLLD